ncbi:MAG: hypothetical protein WA883_00850 [Phormidesmis sp.]
MSSKPKAKTETATDIATMTVTLIAEELNIEPEMIQDRWPGLNSDTELDAEQEERIRYWAAELALTPERRELRNLLKSRMIDADRQNAALDEVERLIALAHSSDGEELPADSKEAAFIKTIYASEKKLQGRMAGLMPALAEEVYVTEAGEVVRPSVAIAQIETKRYDSPALQNSSVTVPVLSSGEN